MRRDESQKRPRHQYSTVMAANPDSCGAAGAVGGFSTCYEDVGIADLGALDCYGVYCMKDTSGYEGRRALAWILWLLFAIGMVWVLVGVHAFFIFVLVARSKRGIMS